MAAPWMCCRWLFRVYRVYSVYRVYRVCRVCRVYRVYRVIGFRDSRLPPWTAPGAYCWWTRAVRFLSLVVKSSSEVWEWETRELRPSEPGGKMNGKEMQGF